MTEFALTVPQSWALIGGSIIAWFIVGAVVAVLVGKMFDQ